MGQQGQDAAPREKIAKTKINRRAERTQKATETQEARSLMVTRAQRRPAALGSWGPVPCRQSGCWRPGRRRIQGDDHPDTLRTRGNIANWTGHSGDAAGALRPVQELLPDQVRVLGPDHPQALGTRGNIATWTSERGDAAGALRLSQELLPDQVRVLGPRPPRHPDRSHQHCALDRSVRGRGRGTAPAPGTAARSDPSRWPRPPQHPDHPHQHRGLDRPVRDAAGALRLAQELLPDLVRVLGPDHPNTLTTRADIAHWMEVVSGSTTS